MNRSLYILAYEPAVPVYISSSCFFCAPDDTASSAADPVAGETGCLPSPRMAELPDFRDIIPNPNLRRRMGRLLRMAVGCGLKTVENVPSEDIAGIITSTGLGFMKDTIAFADMMTERRGEMLNPSPFMQSTFNTASGYIAQIRSVHSYNTTYVHRSGGFAAALTDAMMLCMENPGKGVLAGGFDEVTHEVDILRRRLGVWKSPAGGFHPLGEGAGFVYLTCRKSPVRLLGIYPADSCPELNDGTPDIPCSRYLGRTGAFHSILPVVLCIVLGEGRTGRMIVRDDVNGSGAAVMVEIASPDGE